MANLNQTDIMTDIRTISANFKTETMLEIITNLKEKIESRDETFNEMQEQIKSLLTINGQLLQAITNSSLQIVSQNSSLNRSSSIKNESMSGNSPLISGNTLNFNSSGSYYFEKKHKKYVEMIDVKQKSIAFFRNKTFTEDDRALMIALDIDDELAKTSTRISSTQKQSLQKLRYFKEILFSCFFKDLLFLIVKYYT